MKAVKKVRGTNTNNEKEIKFVVFEDISIYEALIQRKPT